MPELIECLDDRTNVFVTYQSANCDVKVLFLPHQGKSLDIYRRINHLGPPPVAPPNSARRVLGVGDEIINAVGGNYVPLPQSVQQISRQQPRDAPSGFAAAQIVKS